MGSFHKTLGHSLPSYGEIHVLAPEASLFSLRQIALMASFCSDLAFQVDLFLLLKKKQAECDVDASLLPVSPKEPYLCSNLLTSVLEFRSMLKSV